MLVVLFAGCGTDPAVEIVSPVDGSSVTSFEPLVLTLEARDLVAYGSELTIGGLLQSPSVATSTRNGCENCTFEITVQQAGIPNGTHEIVIHYEEDLVTVARDEVTLVFSRPMP